MFEVLLARQAKAWPEQLCGQLSPAVTLPQGLVLVPLTNDVKERLAPGEGTPVLGFDKLTAGIASAAADASHYGPIVYLHQETFGGAGFEASAVWRAGRLAFGPLFTATNDDERITSAYVVVRGTASNAINEALRYLDIDRGAAVDEYAAIGLNRHRATAAWLNDS